MHQETVGDEFFTILCLHFGSGDLVSAGDIVMEVETSKAVLEIDADADGIIEYRCKAGDELRNGALLFVLYDPQGYRPGSDDDGLRDMDDPHPPAVLRPLFSKKALALIRENDIPESKFKGRDVVTREDVERLISEPASAPDSAERKPVTPVVCDPPDGAPPPDKD
jgi:pyruvate/2-oxoglutarate dehydrogenase complex dihydrolipoamide acyltransferase (E2) component